ncbi:thiamine pyrophosphate-binding protein [Ruminococcus sp. OA3]|uniref:thiamine pyrophosphate-binding protein n=1 Tax=Ruminococcus sp. OA3 TaxID=2914164 RepID=UPI001F05C768|nr:thiamine pyrophosphate-binding protein [Ruminococcus sp. OA3]MCH1981364.1 thiamine pyrophosphate-binding protein [Ruminococcus sp. OA3]
MKKKVSDYIADTIADSGVCDVFTVTGGGAMHLNDSFGHHGRLRCTYHHHEQASAMAAEAYARVDNRMAAVCVTSGPGATNAITGVLCAWTDSIPMLVFSGQVRYATTVRSTGLALRTMGVQEYDIVQSVAPMTKYAVMVTDAKDIRYHLERAMYLAVSGRPGPVWLDLPLDVQGAVVQTDELRGYDPSEDAGQQCGKVSRRTAKKILDKIRQSSRPVLFVGNGVRLAGAMDSFHELAGRLGVPVVTGMSSVDAMETADPLYVGRNGGTGDRAGNFAVQNSDLLLSIGSRQSLLQTGFQYQSWAREAYTILNDIDGEELKKPNLHVNLPVVADAADLIQMLLQCLREAKCTPEVPLFQGTDWKAQCRRWKERYPVVTEEHYRKLEDGRTNIYAFCHEMTSLLKEGANLVVSVGTARVAASQSAVIKKGQRFITNPNTASMGYCLPAAIGVARASGGEVVCVTGEGSLQMNLQELQTIRHNRFPVKLFVINNEGYHSIRQTQMSFFGEPLVGVGEESGDLSFPRLEKLAAAYGFPYRSLKSSESLKQDLTEVLGQEGAVICEVFVTKKQYTQPKTASRRLPGGSMFSAPLEDMYPFLEREELRENMWIPLVDEGVQL